MSAVPKQKRKHVAPSGPKRPVVTHGGTKVQVPVLHGAVGPSSPELLKKYGKFNEPVDVQAVEYYFSRLADVEFLAVKCGPLEKPDIKVTQAAAAAKCWDDNLNQAIKQFQQKVGIMDPEETRWGIIRPDGPTLVALVDYGDIAEKLENVAHSKKHPQDFIYRGHFDENEFFLRYEAEFANDGHFSKSKEPKLRQFLRMLAKDPLIIDIRWMAYILATVYWETAFPELYPTGKNVKGKPQFLRRWLTQWYPVEESGHGAGRRYELPVKVKKLPDGGARVTEQDGDQWTVDTSGNAKAITKKAALGVAHGAHATKSYKDDDGDEHTYYGRGYAQLTWWSNYARVGAQINMGLDLLFDPDQALDPLVSYKVFSYSVRTGNGFANHHKLSDFFYGTTSNYVGARHMVNGKDHAGDIARYARIFEKILMDSKKDD